MTYVMDNVKLLNAIRTSIQTLETQKSKSRLFHAWCPQQNARLNRMMQSPWYKQPQFLDPLTVIYMLQSIMVETPHSELAMLLHTAIADEIIFNNELVSFKTGDEVKRLASKDQGIYRVNQTQTYSQQQKDLPQFFAKHFNTVYSPICEGMIDQLKSEGYPAKQAEHNAKTYLGYDLEPLEARNRRASMGVKKSGR